jgi:predicted transcriptional regulator
VVSPLAYDELTEKLRFIEAVEHGLSDAEAGKTTPHAKVVAAIRKRYGAKSK